MQLFLNRCKIKFKVLLYSIKECATLDNIRKFKILNAIDIYHCIYGTYIDYLYWNYNHFLHPLDSLQLQFRHLVMDEECYNNGTCKKCGCTTTALQGAKKSCNNNCYPYWMDRKTFLNIFVHVTVITNVDNTLSFKYNLKEDIVKLYKQRTINKNITNV